MLNLVPSSMLLRPVSMNRNKDEKTRNEDNPKSVHSPFSETTEDNLDEICFTVDSPNAECNETNNLQLVKEVQLLNPVNSKCLEEPGKKSFMGKNQNRNARQASNQSYFPPKKKSHSMPQPFPGKQCHLYFSHLKNPFFYIFTWSFLFSQLAYFIPTFHLAARAKTLGIDPMDTSYIISVAGKKYFDFFLLL